MMAWFFAPPRAWTRLPCLVAVSWTYWAIGVEPTKRDAVHVRVGQEPVDGFLVAVQDLEDAVGQAGFLPELGEQHRGGGVAFGGLEDERVAGGDGHRRHPQRHHDGEVERGDAGDHAEGFAEGEDVDAGGDLVRVVALEQGGDAAGVLDDLEAAADFALGVGEDLAVLGGDQLGEVVHVGGDEFTELEQHSGALGQGDVAPGVGGGAGGGDGGVQVGAVGQAQLSGDGAGGRVVDRAGCGSPSPAVSAPLMKWLMTVVSVVVAVMGLFLEWFEGDGR